MTFFTYNGISSADFGLHIESKNIFSAPEYDISFQSIPGRSGDLIVSNNRFANVKVTYTVFVRRNTVEDLSDLLRAVKGWLYTEPDRYHEIADSYDSLYLRYGVISGSLDIEDQLNKVGCFTVTFNCKPYRYKKDGLLETPVTSGSSLFNPEAFSAKPLITLTGNGDFMLTLQNGGYNRSWQFKGIESGITCDSEQMNFYSGTTPMNDKVSGDGFPRLQPGVNTISWVGTVTSLVVQPRWVTL